MRAREIRSTGQFRACELADTRLTVVVVVWLWVDHVQYSTVQYSTVHSRHGCSSCLRCFLVEGGVAGRDPEAPASSM